MDPTILDRLLAIGSLLRQDERRALHGTSLSEPRLQALWVLHHSGPISQQRLAQALHATPRSVSGLIDALERSGHVERSPHPSDRRAVLVSLTALAVDLMVRMQDDRLRLSESLRDAVAPEDRDAFERGVDEVFWSLNDRHRTRSVQGRHQH